MKNFKKSKKFLSVALAVGVLSTTSFQQVFANNDDQNLTKYKAVQLEAVPTKEMVYYKNGDPNIPSSINWVTTNKELDFLPSSVIGDVNCTVKDAENVYWVGTKNGLQRIDFNEKDARDIVQYLAGPRYLYGGDDNVLALASDGAGGVWAKSASGVTHITMTKKTMEQKAEVYEDLIKSVNDRRGMVTDGAFTFTDTQKSYIDYNSPTGKFVGAPTTNDNDGLWTAMYALGEIFRYRTLINDYGLKPTPKQEEEIAKAKAAAIRATKAVLLLSYVSGRDNGFPSRSYMLTSEAGAQTTDGTDYGFQNTNGFWFHSRIGQPNPNGIIPGMKRTDKEPIGYSIVRVTKDSLTKRGSKLFTSTSFHDPMSYNGLGLSQAALDELNKTRPAGQKLGVDIKTQVANDDKGNPIFQVMPVITSSTNKNSTSEDKTTNTNNKPVFQLTVPIYSKIPKIFNDLFPASAIGSDGYIDQNQIVYKADTSSDEVDGHYALFYTAFSFLCDDTTDELKELKKLIADTTYKMTKLILKDDNYYVEDATGKATQWSRWMSKYFNDQISVMEKQVQWKSNVGVDANGDDALSYGYEDGPLNALEVMATLKTAMTVTKDYYPNDQELFQKAYDMAYDSSYSKDETYVNGKGYMKMALEYIERRLVRQATNAYNINDNNIVDKNNPPYSGNVQEDSNVNATIHNDWTQYINYSDEELGWFPVYELIMQEKDPVRHKQIVESYGQWFENEKREENPFYTFLYQLANPNDTSVDLESAVRYLYRSPQFRIKFPAQYDRQDVLYIEPGDRDSGRAQTNYALPLDEQNVHKNNANPFSRGSNGVSYTSNTNYNYNAGSMDCGTVFTLSYWFGRYFDMIDEVKK